MAWYVGVAYFFGGSLLVNAIPHFVQGVSGRRFPSPFAKPPGRGESPPVVNVLWGTANLVMAYLLLIHVGHFDAEGGADIGLAAGGGFLTAVGLAKAFGDVYSEK